MKMAKASERDIDAAGDLMALLNTIDDGYYPADADDDDAPLHFDEDDNEHLRLFYDKVKALLDRAPGFPGRVIGGMCYVIMFDENEIIDPNSDVIELHPRLTDALKDAERYRWLRSVNNNGFRFDGPDDIGRFEVKQKIRPGEAMYYRGPALDAAIDAAIAAQSKADGKEKP